MAEGPEMTSRPTSYGKQTPRPPDGIFGANCTWVHGCYRTSEYRTYICTKSRCVNPKNPEWQYYGARGIEFRFRSFVEFRDHLGPRPAGMILGRINDGHFEIGNVCWTTRRKSAKTRKAYRKPR